MTFYERNRNNGGGIQERLFEASLATLSIITTSHFKKADRLVEIIAGNPYANMIMVAGEEERNGAHSPSWFCQCYILWRRGLDPLPIRKFV
jgi:hypothetical protein